MNGGAVGRSFHGSARGERPRGPSRAASKMAVDSLGEDHAAGKRSRRAFYTLRQARLEARVLSA